MPAAVIDEPLVGDCGQEPGETQLGHRDHLAPPFEAGQRLHDGGDLAQGAGHAGGRLRRTAEADGDGESRLPLANRLLDLEAKSVRANLVVAGFGS